MASDDALALATPAGPSAGSSCGDYYCVASRSRKRRSREARRAIRDAQLHSLHLRDLLHSIPGDHNPAHVHGNMKKPDTADNSLPNLSDLMFLLQDVSQRLRGIEHCLAIPCGYAPVCESTVPMGVPAEFLEMQCNAVRKLQSWFRRKIDNAWGEKQDDQCTRSELPASNKKTSEELLPTSVPSEAQTEWVPAEPRRPLSAYFLFVRSRCRAFGESSADYNKRLGAEWSALPNEQLAVWSGSAAQLEESFKKQKQEYRKYGKYKEDVATLQGPGQAFPQSSEELPEFNVEYMRASIDKVFDQLPDSMPQWLDVPAEVGQGITNELKAMFPNEAGQAGIAQYSRKQVRELIDLTCKTCLEAALECKRASVLQYVP